MLSQVEAHQVAVVVAWVIVPLHVLVIVQLDVEDVLQIVQGHVLVFVLQAAHLTVLARVGDVGEDVQIAIKTNWGF